MNNSFKPAGTGSPYYNDYDASKNYMQILFNPAVAVQARELSQSQSVLQNQIASHGSYMFRDGSPVNGARIRISYNQPFMKVGPNDSTGQPIDVNLLKNLTFIGSLSAQKITIVDVDDVNRYVYFSYLGGAITDGETFTSITTPTRSFTMISNSIGTVLTANCSAGSIFISGYFINIDDSNIIVANNDVDATYNIGFSINEAYINASDDASLNDPASGTTNFNAPGADRYKLSASLYSFKGDTVPAGVTFIQGIVVNNKKIIKAQPDSLSGSELLDVLAKRTYDESGSYTVNPWKVQLYDHDTDNSKYLVSIQEGSGYIRGYNVTTIIPNVIENTKSRAYKSVSDVTIFNDTGLYTYALYNNNIISGKNIPDFNSALYVKSGTNGTGTTLGECYISTLYHEGTKMRIYIYNAQGVINAFSGARSFVSKTDANKYINLFVNITDCAELYGQETPFILKMPVSNVKDITTQSINYQIVKKYIVVSEVSGNTINVVESDATIDFLSTEGLLSIIKQSDGTYIDITNVSVTPNNTSNVSTASITGSTIENGTEYIIVMRVKAENVSPRIKTITTITENITVSSDTTEVSLSKEDIYDVISISQTTNTNDNTPTNLKSYVTLNNGQSDYTYEKGKLTGLNSASLKSFMATPDNGATYSVTYRYFEHSGTGPFCVNSYISSTNINAMTDIDDLYSTIPVYRSSSLTDYVLRDCYDFRVKRSELNTLAISEPRTEITSSLNKYLPRIDTVYVNSSGEFGVVNGISSENPIAPTVNEYSMPLYNLLNEPYGSTVKNVSLKYIDNKRYTMKDIGKLDTRLTNAEDALSISQLEQSALNMQITDDSGLNKYKTGIFTDSFASFDNSDYTNSEWDANIDAMEQSLRCNFNVKNVPFSVSSSNMVNTSKSSALLHLNYTTSVYAKNDFASNTVNVQKLMFYVWNGTCSLTPSVDTWVNDLGQFIVSTNYVNTPEPPTTYKSWTVSSSSTSSSSSRFGSRSRYENWGVDITTTTATTDTTYTTTTSYNSSWLTNNKVTDMQSQDAFMRTRRVSYNLHGMRPGMSITGKMNNVNLTLSNNIIGSDGTCSGTFTVPSNMPVGTKNVLFSDNSNTSSAETTYTANGITIWQDVDRTYIRQWTPVSNTSSVTSTSVSTSTNRVVQGYDPVAESIYVEEPNGIYVDSIDVYFATKDPSMPVYLYMVEMENGYPTTRQLPFSMVVKQPSEVNLSEKATVATNFKFECPVYLSGATEYAFIVATGSYKYSVFISTLGEPDFKTGIGIYDQPYTGSMFLSQNARTWNAEQQSDVTFKLHKCVFDTSVTGSAIFNLDKIDESYPVALQNIVANDFNVTGTSIKYEYKWNTEGTWTEFNNRDDISLTSLKTIGTSVDTNYIQMRATLKTSDANLSPIIDLEQVYGIFCNNTTKASNDQLYPYIAGTYISKPVSLKYESDDIRVILDAICPNQSEVDVYVQTTVYKPVYVTQSSNGNLGTDAQNLELLDGKQLQVYYYNTDTNKLEPKSSVEMTGYNTSNKIVYLKQVSTPDDFKNASSTSLNDSVYIGIDSKYTSILLLPIYSTTDVSLTAWNNSSTYATGSYVTYQGNIWKAVRAISANTIPSDMSILWEKVPSIKTISVTKNGNEITWRKMKKEQNSASTIDKANKFIEYTYYPEIDIESEFKTFSIKVVMKSKDTVNIPRVRNLRAIATL